VNLLNSTDIHLMPTMNPDGFERATKGVCRGYSHDSGRTNVNGKDLNRDFPGWDMLGKNRFKLFKGRAPETKVTSQNIRSMLEPITNGLL
jgi:murein tripeptide amidase MpaA